MNIKRILCPIDFSEYNQSANEYACALAQSTGAMIVYFYAHLSDVYSTPPKVFDTDEEMQKWTSKLQEFVKPAKDGIDAAYIVEFGIPTERIVHYANHHQIDLIVMSTHGRTGLSRVIMGSVAEAVVRKADCPVLAIKTNAVAAADSPAD